ncbi:GYF domain-containing protein [Pseudoxanthomonas suwonensis]|jgi:Pilin (bacterial filament).|uniref:GYF domain-containing protein n=1 Tax=Pseudoxanthomonas suwonensis TaxID=314722 RepID=UPI00138F8C40|nr:GYF domain-containing protein [Pseudoxanthomonas suwonensis]KAF1698626.1 pilus assembly protein PilA [Pseudoxanthomonas suwonensis]
MTDWYYALDGQRHGPVQAAELAGLARSGAIAPQTLVWRDGLAQWSPLSAMAGELGLGNVPPPLPRTPPVAVAPPPPRGRSGCILAVALIGGGLFLVLALGILAAIAVPAYNDYTLRSTAAAAINEARVHQPVVVAFLGEHGRCPTNDDEGFGPATDYAGPHVASIRFGEFEESTLCGMVATIHAPGRGKLDGEPVWLEYNAAVETWLCSSAVEDRYLPHECRG